MSDVEILGRPKYRSTKPLDRTEQLLTEKRIRYLSERNKNSKHRPIDLVYERDERDWWCDDV
jgi:hypothetical protein